MLPDRPETFENQMVSMEYMYLRPMPPISLKSLPTNSHIFQTEIFQPKSNPIDYPYVELISPNIYLTNSSEFWTPEMLRCHGYTHLIYIDKNNHFLDFQNKKLNGINLGEEFNVLELDFGEAAYLKSVLPNCYKAVKFIDTALKNNGAILIIERNNNQKCLTIVTGFLMYKNNLNFYDAFEKVKKVCKKAELGQFFISQLYEYEPILQVQKAQARGTSCSRELRCSFLKRKKLSDNFYNSYITDVVME